MSRYGGKDLFGSGPHRFEAGGLAQRHVRHEQPGADGAAVTVLGRTARSIEQRGTLLADGVGALLAQTEAIEAALGGEAELIDDIGRSWPNVMMLEFKAGRVRRVGQRLAMDYRVRYVQVRT